ncbi:MAG: fused MFS/spermidine synthase [Nitrospirae bacterium]|nr:fused MFS/spermidine synthase [Nitrospirota bacterium]
MEDVSNSNVKTRGISLLRAYTISFAGGFGILLLEILGFRLFAPFYGNSVYISGSMITMVLTALSVGYVVGGILADKYTSYRALLIILYTSTGYLVVIGFTHYPIMGYFLRFGAIWGAICSSFTLFFIPMMLMSMISPYLIKILADAQNVGKISGSIFAVSTVGSIAGSLLTTFYFIPRFGSHTTLIGCIGFLFVVFGACTTRQYKFLILLGLIVIPMHLKKTAKNPDLIFEKESPYNLVMVFNVPEGRAMVLNTGALQGMAFNNALGDSTSVFRYIGSFSVIPLLTDTRDILVLGTGAGMSVNNFLNHYDAMVDAVEIDPLVIDVARNYFNMDTTNPRLKVYAEDAKNFVRRIHKKYDIVEIDVYHGGFYIPFYLATREFFQEIKAILQPDGIMVMNVLGVLGAGNRSLLVNAIGNTISSVYPKTYAIKSGGNTVIVAASEKYDEEYIKNRILQNMPVELSSVANNFLTNLVEMKFDKNNPLLTDDKSNLEELTFRFLSQKL